eukprot:1101658-Amphidinium_carterae.1
MDVPMDHDGKLCFKSARGMRRWTSHCTSVALAVHAYALSVSSHMNCLPASPRMVLLGGLLHVVSHSCLYMPLPVRSGRGHLISCSVGSRAVSSADGKGP